VLIYLIRKEIKEMLTMSTLIYMVAMALIFGLTGQLISSSQEGAADKAIIAIENHDTGAYAATLVGTLEAGAEVVYKGDDVVVAREALERKQGVALLTIPADFTDRINSGQQAEVDILWFMQGAGLMDSMPQSMIEGLLSTAKEAISAQLIQENSTLKAEIVLDPAQSIDTTEYKGKMIKGLTPGEISGLLGSKTTVIPVAVMMLILMASSSVISSMGMEKENRTLETLLTLPIRRSYIIISKIVGSAVVGLIMGVIYMAGFYSYFNSLGGSTVSLQDMGLALNSLDYILIGLSVFAALLAALCLSIILGSFASNYRSAQTLTFPIIGLAMLPMMLTMFQDFDTMSLGMKLLIFLIPFSHPMMAMKALMMDNYLLVVGGIAYSLGITAVLVLIATWVFTTDRVVTGTVSRKFSLWRRR
jgi:ABC-2 type transport system permease protein